jgi:hypothetical protein
MNPTPLQDLREHGYKGVRQVFVGLPGEAHSISKCLRVNIYT